MFKAYIQRYTLSEFEDLVKGIALDSGFAPTGVCLHHTWRPNASQWDGRNWRGVLQAMQREYERKGWHSGPHLYIDPEGVYVYTFTPLSVRGVHAVAFNGNKWGVEMVGDFGGYPGEGAPIPPPQRDLVLHALAILFRKIGVPPTDTSLVFHREDSNAHKTCPGLHIEKADLLQDLKAVMVGFAGVALVVNGTKVPAFQSAGTTWAHARALLSAAGGDLSRSAAGVLTLSARGRRLTMAPGTYQVRDGSAYVPLRSLVEKLGGSIGPTANGRIEVRL